MRMKPGRKHEPGEWCLVTMYHRVGVEKAGREPGEDIYAVPEEAFREQLDYLHEAGHAVVDLSDLMNPRISSSRGRSTVLTFDDGSDSDSGLVAPLLARAGFPATFFVTPAWVGTPGFLEWSDVQELRRIGMTIGAHGLDHTPLSSLKDAELRRHLREARREIGARLGDAPTALSLPGGAGGRRELEAALEEGFEIVAGSVPRRFRPGSRLRVVPRFAIRSGDSLGAFIALVEQRPHALAMALGRYALLVTLRRALGDRLYQALRARWSRGARS